MSVIVFVIKSVFLIVACTFWAVLGTVFWVALAARALVTFTTVFLYSMFTGQQMSSIYAELDQLTDLWFRGFRNAHQSLFSKTEHKYVEVRNLRLTLEILWAALFWLMLYIAADPFKTTPLPAFGHYGKELASFVGGFATELVNSIGKLDVGWYALSGVLLFIGGIIAAYWFDSSRTTSASSKSDTSSK